VSDSVDVTQGGVGATLEQCWPSPHTDSSTGCRDLGMLHTMAAATEQPARV
jgi:hypothetical protein